MAAVYPTAIKNFAYRQDFTQLVDAADVNVAYDEITALQNTLGTNPQSDTIDGKTYTWASVKSNISAARKGVANPSGFFRVFDYSVPYHANNGATPGLFPPFSDAPWDTHGMWSMGSDSLVSPRDGIYNFSFYTEWQRQSEPYDFWQLPFERNGYAQVGLQFYKSGRYLTGYNHGTVTGAQYAIRGSASANWEWPKGTPMSVALSQTFQVSRPANVCIYLFVTYLRAMPTTNNL